MNNSLKQILLDVIQDEGELSTYQMETIAHQNNYKVSNAERRLRELINEGKILPKRNEKRAIIGYKKAQSNIVSWLNEGIGPSKKQVPNNQLF